MNSFGCHVQHVQSRRPAVPSVSSLHIEFITTSKCQIGTGLKA